MAWTKREHDDLREHDRDRQTGAEGRPVLDHGRELIGSGEQRQRQRDADEPEGDSADDRPKDGELRERSGESRHDPDCDDCDQRERTGIEAERNCREQLPILILVRRQRVEPDERRRRDREIHRERDRGRQQTCYQRVGKACRLWARESSSVRIDARIGDDNRPPYAADIPMSVFVLRTSSLSFRRSETQVPSPPPIFPRASSGPRLAPPASDTSETATAPDTVEGSTRWSLSSSHRARQLERDPKEASQHTNEQAGPRGHRHPPEAPVEPSGVFGEREPEVGAAVDQAQKRQPGKREHDAEQDRVAHEHPEPG